MGGQGSTFIQAKRRGEGGCGVGELVEEVTGKWDIIEMQTNGMTNNQIS